VPDRRRELEREHQPQSMRLQGGRLDVQRPSPADERQITKEVRDREQAERAAKREAFERDLTRVLGQVDTALEAVRRTLGDAKALGRDEHRALSNARGGLRQIKARHLGADTRP
jgi:hypothetical protein